MKRSLSVFGVIFLLILPFQNCAPNNIQFQTDAESMYNVYGELPANAKVAEFQAEESVEYPSTQLNLIVDNSSTMKQSQEELAARVEGLLASLATKKVSVRVLNTSTYLSSVSPSVYGSLKTGSEVYVNSASELTPGDVSAIIKTVYAPNPTAIVLDPRDSVTVRQSRVSAVKNAVLTAGITGSDNESGLCGILQWAANSYKKTEQNEKVVFFLLTDEDNYAAAKHCTKESVSNYDYVTSVKYKQTWMGLNFEGVGYRDGASATTETKTFVGTLTLLPGQSTEGLVSGQSCLSADLTRAQNYVAGFVGKTSSINGVNFHFNEAKLTDCKYAEPVFTFYPNESEGVKDFCVQPYQGSANIMAHLAKAYPGVSATQPCQMDAPTWIKRGLVRTDYFLNNSSDIAADFLSDIAQTPLNGNYFMAVVMNKRGQSCALKSGQSYGDIFDRLQAQSPANVQTYSICQTDEGYKQAFDKIASSVSYVSQQFPLEIPADFKIRDVLLFHQGKGSPEKLTADQYEVVDGNIKFNVKLSKTDVLKVIMF